MLSPPASSCTRLKLERSTTSPVEFSGESVTPDECANATMPEWIPASAMENQGDSRLARSYEHPSSGRFAADVVAGGADNYVTT